MRKLVSCFLIYGCLLFMVPTGLWAEDGTSLTIYNGGFAAVREHVALDLKSGINPITFSGATTTLEPESVILRDSEGKRSLQILEQSYRADTISQGLLLSLYEGKTIEFIVGRTAEGKDITASGKIIRSGYMTANPQGGQYNPGNAEPVIEMNGQLRFSLPGQPIFPDLGTDTVLKPRLNWLLQTDHPGPVNAELAYITNGMSWEADYNLVVPEKGDVADVVGWITMHNNSGKTFENARIRLMAGDVNKIQPQVPRALDYAARNMAMKAEAAPVVTEKAFDEFHLYTLERPATLHEQETKQVEFVHAMNVTSRRIYVYDGMQGYYTFGSFVGDIPNYGSQMNKKVWVMQEFKNSKENGLGMALPKGRVRFYRRDSDGSLQFIGENQIDHTPKDETVRLYTGNTFDVVGERRQTDFHMDRGGHQADETFEVKVRNHKKEALNVRVVEHLYRWSNWKITSESDKHIKTDAQTVEFHVNVAPDQEKVVTYTVHYSW